MLIPRSTLLLLLLAECLALFSGGCALVGGSEERLRHAKGYNVTSLADWKAQDPQEGDLAYRLPSGAEVTLVSSCGRSDATPLNVLARQLLFGLHNLTIERREKREFGGNQGLFTKAQGILSGTRLYLELFTTVSNACVFDFSMISPRAIPPADEQQFFSYLSSFRYGNH